MLHAQSIFFSKQMLSVFVFHYNITRGRDERDWERKRRREECCSKSQEGGIYVDVGEIHLPPSLGCFLSPFFFYYRGEAGAPTITASSSQIRRGDECVYAGRNAKEKGRKEEKNMTVIWDE